MERSYIKDLRPGKKVMIKGWVYEIRRLSNITFFLIRDMSGVVQCIFKDPKITSEITFESVVEIEGKTKKAEVKADLARKDLEIEGMSLKILNKAEKLPLQVNEKTVKAELPTRLDYRSLDVRKPRIYAIFKIQSTIINAFREFFHSRGFTEGGTDLFEAQYFGKKVYLAQSPQLYKQLAAISMEKVFSTSPVWRAEKHDTSKHINELRQMDIEVAFVDDQKIMKYLEEVVKFIVKKVIKERANELELLGIKLKVPAVEYLSYGEAILLLNRHGFKIKSGDDFDPEAERKLCEIFPNTLIFTYEWPTSIKPFYIWPKNENGEISGGFDAVYGGMEISSGGQRVHVPEILIRQLKNKGLKPEDFSWYINAFRWGAPQHAGWSIGLERFTQALLGLENIREGTLFPRDRRRLTP
jgi:nondiscriminating aspartyl-tRNA synthetase